VVSRDRPHCIHRRGAAGEGSPLVATRAASARRRAIDRTAPVESIG
jgi:hypothetical protein